MAEAAAPPPTAGMRLDQAIASLDNLSSTQLYVLIVGVTIAIALTVLPPVHGEDELRAPPQPQRRSSAVKHSGRPEPRWHIFKWVNYAALIVLVGTVLDFSLHCHAYVSGEGGGETLKKFLIGWSILLCYFFGFFGVSFVHDTMNEEEEEEEKNGSSNSNNNRSSTTATEPAATTR